jgi:DNA-binding protein YbaB
MTSPYEGALTEALAGYEQRRARLRDAQRELGAVTATATAPRRVVKITVGRGGAVTEVKFPTSVYKNMTPAELATVVMQTIEQARSQVLDRAAELLKPTLPPGIDARKLVAGETDLDSLVDARTNPLDAAETGEHHE